MICRGLLHNPTRVVKIDIHYKIQRTPGTTQVVHAEHDRRGDETALARLAIPRQEPPGNPLCI